MPPVKPKLEAVAADLNIVLDEKQITAILKQVLGPKGGKIGDVKLASDHCCVDGSVGSSVAGPVSSVGSSISATAGGDAAAAASIRTKIARENLAVKVTVPRNVKVT